MNMNFEHNYQQRYLIASFETPTVMRREDDILQLREQWMNALTNWHSPYKAIIDGRNLDLQVETEHRDEFKKAFARTIKLLSGFFLKKAVVFGIDAAQQDLLPLECYDSEEAAREAIGLNRNRENQAPQNFRDSIQFQNHFRQHVVELSFAQDVLIDEAEKVEALKSKLTNNLMQWHSAWSLLVDCSHLEVHPDQFPAFEKMLGFFRGFFLKQVVGYSPKKRGLAYPFTVHLARHKAAAQLEAEGQFSGDEANCRSAPAPKAKS
jgi:hypothetical protein